MVAEHLAERLVQEMGGRVVAPNLAAASVIDFKRKCRSRLQRAFLQLAEMREEVARLLLRVGDTEARTLARKNSVVADLAAALAVERRLIEDHRTRLALLERADFLAIAHECRDHALGTLGFVAEKLAGAGFFAQRKPHRLGGGVARARPGGARLFALALHRARERLRVDLDAARPERVLGEIERKAVGVVELEGGLAGKLRPACNAFALLFEQSEPARERFAKPRLLQLQRLADQRLGAHEFGIGLAHFAHERR